MVWEQFVHKAEIIFNRLSAIEMRQCHDSLSENEAVRLLEMEFFEWDPNISLSYFHRQFEYFRFKLHTVRVSKNMKSMEQLLGELLAVHLKLSLKQQYDTNGEIRYKLRIMAKRNYFFTDLEEFDTPAKLFKELHVVEAKLRSENVAFCALGDRPFFMPGVGAPKRG